MVYKLQGAEKKITMEINEKSMYRIMWLSLKCDIKFLYDCEINSICHSRLETILRIMQKAENEIQNSQPLESMEWEELDKLQEKLKIYV